MSGFQSFCKCSYISTFVKTGAPFFMILVGGEGRCFCEIYLCFSGMSIVCIVL